MINVGVIGYGYWGPNLVRNLAEISDSHVVAVSDLRSERLTWVHRHYPSVETSTNCSDLLNNPRIDAIVIATPASTHFELAMKAIQAGKHVLVEKPLASTSEQAARLIEEAERRALTLMVDHTFVYTGAVRTVQKLVASTEIGGIYYYDSVRVNLGLFQHDVNVIWDLAVHDISIMDYVLPSQPCAVSATGMSHIPGEPEDVAYLTLFFDGCLIAHIHVNWLAPVKVRRTLIGGNRKMIVYDDLEPSEKIKVYDTGIIVNGDDTVYQMLIDYRVGDMWAPYVDRTEALRTGMLHFIHCIEKHERPITDGSVGLRVIRILEAATRSLRERGQLVNLNAG